MYLEETCFDLGLLGPSLLSLSEGNDGGLLGLSCCWVESWEGVLGFWGFVVEAVPEIEATIIAHINQRLRGGITSHFFLSRKRVPQKLH